MREVKDMKNAFGQADESFRNNVHLTLAKLQNEEEKKSMKKISLRLAFVAATIVLTSTLLVGFAYGSQIIQLLGGGQIETGRDSRGHYVSISTGFEFETAEVRDGQIYFVLDDYNKNITSYCSETTYYQYERIADNGYRHVIIVGGTPDNLGWAEFIFDDNGVFFGSNATYLPVDAVDGVEKPMWLINANEALGGFGGFDRVRQDGFDRVVHGG